MPPVVCCPVAGGACCRAHPTPDTVSLHLAHYCAAADFSALLLYPFPSPFSCSRAYVDRCNHQGWLSQLLSTLQWWRGARQLPAGWHMRCAVLCSAVLFCGWCSHHMLRGLVLRLCAAWQQTRVVMSAGLLPLHTVHSRALPQAGCMLAVPRPLLPNQTADLQRS
jgi:hypothetical protein